MKFRCLNFLDFGFHALISSIVATGEQVSAIEVPLEKT